LLVFAAALTVSARQTPSGPPQPPAVTFKVEVNYVEIDATILDAAGNTVRDLRRDEFQLLEDGKPQTVSAFTRVDLPVVRPDPPLYRQAAIEPDSRSNREDFNGRVFLLVLDDLQTDFRRTMRVKAAARQFVQRFVGANDMVAVVTTGGRSQGSQEFTTSHPRLLAAIARFIGQKIPSATMTRIDDYYAQRAGATGLSPSDTLDAERSHKARNTLVSLRNLADYLKGVRGRRKAIVWFGEGIDYDIDNPFRSRDAVTIRQEMQDAIATATRANVSFYGVDARGLGAGLDEAIEISALPDDPGFNAGIVSIQDEVRRAQDSLRVMSDETGGFAVVNQNDLNKSFARIIEENSTYYLLGYYPTDDRRDGRFRNVQVRVTRPGLTVHARRGYTAPKGKAPASASPLEADASPALREALNSPLPSTGVRFDASAAAFMGKGSKTSVFVVLQIDPASTAFVQKDGRFNDDFEVVMLAIDEKAKLQSATRDLPELNLSPRTHAPVSRVGFRVTRRFEVPPGRYQIRVAVREVNRGGVGSLVFDMDVPDFSKGPLQMSGLALASSIVENAPTANPDPMFNDVLPAPPTPERVFAPGDVLAVFAEVYDNLRTPAHRVSITTTVRSDDGRVVFTNEDERKSEELGGKTGGYGHVREIPLKGFAPGRYVLRVEARTLLSNGGTAVREVEFRIR
jgi:VWFA-related protein